MIRGGLWLSDAARDDGEPPVVLLHHEPRFTTPDGNYDQEFCVSTDPWFDALAMALLAARDRFITLALGLLLVGHWEIASVPAMPRTIRPRIIIRALVRVLVPTHLRTSIHATAPPAGPVRAACMTT